MRKSINKVLLCLSLLIILCFSMAFGYNMMSIAGKATIKGVAVESIQHNYDFH